MVTLRVGQQWPRKWLFLAFVGALLFSFLTFLSSFEPFFGFFTKSQSKSSFLKAAFSQILALTQSGGTFYVDLKFVVPTGTRFFSYCGRLKLSHFLFYRYFFGYCDRLNLSFFSFFRQFFIYLFNFAKVFESYIWGQAKICILYKYLWLGFFILAKSFDFIANQFFSFYKRQHVNCVPSFLDFYTYQVNSLAVAECCNCRQAKVHAYNICRQSGFFILANLIAIAYMFWSSENVILFGFLTSYVDSISLPCILFENQRDGMITLLDDQYFEFYLNQVK